MATQRPPDLLTIGEACELTGFAASALRFYESIDLLEPDWVDPSTGYRYFHPSKLLFLNFLKSMKENGLGLAALKPLVPYPETRPLQNALAGRAKAVRQQLKTLRRQLKWLTEAERKLTDLAGAPAAIVHRPPRWVLQSATGAYDFLGYARARRRLTAQVHRLGLAWKDDFTVSFVWSEKGPALQCLYSLEVIPDEKTLSEAVLLPSSDWLVERVRGPIEGVFDRAQKLWRAVEERGEGTGVVEWLHLVSTAHTANPRDFLTEIAVEVKTPR